MGAPGFGAFGRVTSAAADWTPVPKSTAPAAIFPDTAARCARADARPRVLPGAVAQRRPDGSRGLEPTVAVEPKCISRGGATPATGNGRSSVAPRRVALGCAPRGLKTTATSGAPLRGARVPMLCRVCVGLLPQASDGDVSSRKNRTPASPRRLTAAATLLPWPADWKWALRQAYQPASKPRCAPPKRCRLELVPAQVEAMLQKDFNTAAASPADKTVVQQAAGPRSPRYACWCWPTRRLTVPRPAAQADR